MLVLYLLELTISPIYSDLLVFYGNYIYNIVTSGENVISAFQSVRVSPYRAGGKCP